MIISNEQKPIERVMDNAFSKLRSIVDADTVIGKPLVLEDGTAVEQSSGASRFRDEACTQWSSVYYWQVPVDLEQVTAVWFGETEIPLT